MFDLSFVTKFNIKLLLIRFCIEYILQKKKRSEIHPASFILLYFLE